MIAVPDDGRPSADAQGSPTVDAFAFGEAPLNRSVAWQIGSRLVVQAMALTVQIVLARALLPEDFGAVAVSLAIVNTLLLFVQGGFGAVVTQRSTLASDEVATLFWLSMGVAGLLYGAVWFSAEPVAVAYGDPRLVGFLRVVGTLLFIGAFTNLQSAIAMRRFLFRTLFWASCAGGVTSGLTAVALVLNGAGLWAVAAQTLINQLVGAAVMFSTVRWWPRLVWAPRSAAALLRQGMNLLIPSLLYGAFTGATSLLVGRLYGATVLGYYDRGRLFPEYLFGSLNQAIQSVALPAMSRSQHDLIHVRRLADATLRVSCILLFPMIAGFALIAPDLIPLLLGPNWEPAVTFVQLSSLFFLHIPISHTSQRVIIALGRTDLTLRLNVVEVVAAAGSVALGAYLAGPVGLMVGLVCSGIFSVVLFAFPNGKLIGFGLSTQLRALAPVCLATGILAIGVWVIAKSTEGFSVTLSLAAQVAGGVAIYGTVGVLLGILKPALIDELRAVSRSPGGV